MKQSINQKLRYFGLFLCVVVSILVWLQFTYPRFSRIDLSITRDQALKISCDFLKKTTPVDLESYQKAIIFSVDTYTDRYIQKAIGFDKESQFLEDHGYDLFYWCTRFFKEGQKEEYSVCVSSSTGQVISYRHLLDDAASRPEMTEAEAQKMGQEFLERTFQYDFSNWTFNAKTNVKFDHRTEYTFTWEKNKIYIPWDPDPKSGGGKLLATVVVTGDELQGFQKQSFLVPEQFNRYVERRKESGRNLSLVSNIGSLGMVIGAIWILVLRRNHLAMNVTKRFYVVTIIALFILSVLSGFNNLQGYLYSYPTTQPFTSFILRQIVYEIMDRFLFFVCFIIPCLAGELLRFEIFPRRPQMGIFHYVTTTFFSREVTRTVLLGYCFAIVMIGMQTGIFEFGYRYFDVWVEQSRLSRFSSAYYPFLGILFLAINASVAEETFYRLFGVNFSFKMFRNPALAILIPTVIWGLGHTGYMVFPFWFRGLEVTLLGIFIVFVYLRFGLICVVIQHFLFDAFWASSPYIFGKSANVDFWMSLVVLSLPLIYALIAFLLNKPVKVGPIEWRLTDQQKYNLEILKNFIQSKSLEPLFDAQQLRVQLIKNGWDVAVIDVAFRQLNIPVTGDHTFSGP